MGIRIPSNPNSIRVTPLIYRVLIKPKKEKNKAEGWRTGPQTITKKELFARFDKECQQYSAIILPDQEPKYMFGKVPKIQFALEKRQGGRKHVIHITGLESYGINPKEFAGACRKKFACATTAQALPGRDKKGKMEVKLQGDMIGDVMDFLSDKKGHNIPAKFL